MVDKFDSTLDNPADGPAKPDDKEQIEIEEVGTTVNLDTDSDTDVEIIEDGSAIVGQEDALPTVGFTSNLAEVLDEGFMQSLSSELVEKIEADKSSREDWEQGYTKGLDLLGFKYEERTRPFRGASSVNHPMLAQAVTQFQAMSYVELQAYEGDEYSSGIQEKKDQIDGTRSDYLSDMAELYEVHVDLDLEGFEDIDPRTNEPTGIKLPYIVTIDRGSDSIISIYRNYNQADALRKKNEYFVHYKFLPGLGFYGFGLIHMIGGLTRTATSALRQLLDAGTLSNLPAGFKSRGLRIRDDDQPLQPGEFRDVDAPNGIIREALMPLPYKGPDQTLLQLLGLCVDAAKQFATVADMQLSEIGSSQTPVGTTMALMERGTKVMSAVHKRLHYAQKKEFNLLAKIFKMVLPPMYPYNVAGGPRQIKQLDFDDNIDILPVSDPNIFSMSQRVTLAQNQLQLAQSNPQIHNLYEAYRRMYIALGVKDVEQILPIPKGPQPQDPALEHSVVLKGANLQAFPQQNHELHIKSHRTFMSSVLVKTNPMAVMNLTSHIMQHVSLLATQVVDQAMVEEAEKLRKEFGDQVPPEAIQALQMQRGIKIDEEIQKITEQMVAEEQEAMEGQNTDPLVLLKQQELALRQAEMEMDAQLKGENQALKENQFDYKQVLDSQKLQKDYDLANLRADVARERTNAPKQEG